MAAFIAKLMKYAPIILSVIGALAGGGAWLRPLPGPAPAPSSKISIPATVTVEPGEPAFVKAETAAKNVLWITPDDGVRIIGHDRLLDSTEAIVIPPPSGECRLMAIIVDGDKPIRSDWCIITVNGGRPPPDDKKTTPPDDNKPPPDDKKTNPPDPAPTKPAHLQIVVIEDTLARDEQITAMMMSPYWLQLKTFGHDIRKVDSNRKDYVQHYATQIQKNGQYPTIIIKNLATGEILNKDFRLPATTDDLRVCLGQYTDNLP